MTPLIFITRPVSPQSVFFDSLSKRGCRVWGESLVEFAALPFEQIPPADWYFFYSQKGVEFFFEQIRLKQINVPKRACWAAIGEATALSLQNRVPKVHFVGTGEPQGTAELLKPLVRGQSVVFVQAARSRRSVESLLPDSVQIIRFVVYSNRIRTDFQLPSDIAILVFTSPLNVEAYWNKIPKIDPAQKIVCIGQTTAQKLREYGIENVVVADSPNELALAQAVLNFF